MASAAVRYGRLIRPFPTKRLADATWYVTSRANELISHVTELQIRPPANPDDWFFELQQILGDLHVMREQIDEVIPQIVAMQDDAERAFSVAVDAMQAILRGLYEDDPPDGEREGAPVELAA